MSHTIARRLARPRGRDQGEGVAAEVPVVGPRKIRRPRYRASGGIPDVRHFAAHTKARRDGRSVRRLWREDLSTGHARRYLTVAVRTGGEGVMA